MKGSRAGKTLKQGSTVSGLFICFPTFTNLDLVELLEILLQCRSYQGVHMFWNL